MLYSLILARFLNRYFSLYFMYNCCDFTACSKKKIQLPNSIFPPGGNSSFHVSSCFTATLALLLLHSCHALPLLPHCPGVFSPSIFFSKPYFKNLWNDGALFFLFGNPNCICVCGERRQSERGLIWARSPCSCNLRGGCQDLGVVRS